MSFDTFQQGLQQATDLANRAISIEASLSTLAPLSSALPTLQKAFPVYISSAEVYSHLLASKLVPSAEEATIKKRWRLVLERAEKIKGRIEQLGGQVGRAEMSDQGEEAAVKRRGGRINGVELDPWRVPRDAEFRGDEYRDREQPELAEEQIQRDPIWKELPASSWNDDDVGEDWVMRQGPVSDCSVVAGMGVILARNRRHGSQLAWNHLYPQGPTGRPIQSENGKHVLKLLLNGAWRSIVVDALLPHSRSDGAPLYTTCHPAAPLTSSSSANSLSTAPISAPWAPLALKGYFKAFGGYSIRGSNPAPDIYAFTGWIPERLSLKAGFQREKEWHRIFDAWQKGRIMVSLGTGPIVSEGLVKLHAYGVLALRQEGDERLLDITDPGASAFTMSWDQVCSEFEAVHLNWDPTLFPVTAKRHWSWPKPSSTTSAMDQAVTLSNPQYRLHITASSQDLPEVWILLSQHITTKDRPLDDIALHVFEEYEQGSGQARPSGKISMQPQRADQMVPYRQILGLPYDKELMSVLQSPYANSVHVLVRYRLRRADTTLLVMPARDRGNFQTGFTLHALGNANTSISFERISRTMPYSQNVSGALSSRNAGGHPGCPTCIINPQYRLEVQSPVTRTGVMPARVMLHGEKEVPWNVKTVWGKGDLVADLTGDMIVADTGPYSYGMAYCDVPDLKPGTYTIVVSAFKAGQYGPYTLSVEGTAPISLASIPAEGAGMFSRIISGRWTADNAGGRPSAGSYERNPRVEVILPKPGVILSRLYLPNPSSTPINLTIFRRGTNNTLGEQMSTSGPYSDTIAGVCCSTGRTKLEEGIYTLVPSAYEKGMKGEWVMKVWSDVSLSADLMR